MEEQGVVVELKGTAAVVRVEEAGGCGSCASAGVCKAVEGGRLLEADNAAGASAGQKVVVEISGGAFIKASLVVYMFPVLMLFVGAYLGGEYGPSVSGVMSMEAWQAVSGVVFLALSVIVLRLYDRAVKKGSYVKAVVTRVVGGPMEAK